MMNFEPEIIKTKTKAVWGASPAGTTFGQSFKPGTQEFFDTVSFLRYSYECPWLMDIVKFENFAHKKVLEVGCGAGYDAALFCKNNAHYTGIDITPENIVRTTQHLTLYNLQGTIIEGDVETMTFNKEFDFVYSFGVLHHTPHLEKALAAIYKALKDGGEAELIVYHKHSMFYWGHLFFGDWLLRGKWKKMSFNDRLAQIEYTTSSEKPLVRVYSSKNFCLLLQKAGFTIKKIRIRKLTREELPCLPLISKLYRFIPDWLLMQASKRIGWYLCARVSK